MKTDKNILDLAGWLFRVHVPKGAGPFPVILLLHGWTGDEHAMWVFSRKLPEDSYLIAPRGLYQTPLGGFGWHEHKSNSWPWVDDFKPAIDALRHVLTVDNFPLADFSNMRTMGFSQGAALSFSYALLYPYEITGLAALSGFMPDGAQVLARDLPLLGKRAFLAHGSMDDLVPVQKARDAVRLLEQAGAKVTYCEDDVGHKLSSACFHGLENFFQAG